MQKRRFLQAAAITTAFLGMGAVTAVLPRPAMAAATDLRAEARAALDKAIAYYHGQVASHGGYAYFYSEDLSERWGEGKGTQDQIWVQPPGTPAVGMAFLKAYDATKNPAYLAAAQDAAKALMYGQLQSGAWQQTIDFNPQGTRLNKYRNGKGKGQNNSTLDDDQSQSAMRFLMRLDKELGFKDPEVHESVTFALNALLKAQFPNGAFPQVWSAPVATHPVVKASYPADWPRVWPHEDYWNYYTLNDGLVGTVSDVLILAHETYKDDRYRAALTRLGDFLILAQMPDPQPAWAQQYDYEMHPTWARKFEPPAVAGFESEDAIGTLMKIYRVTGDKKYLAPIPRAIAYLKKNLQPDGLMPRYRELQTNKPLYMQLHPDKTYTLTYSDADLPAHYGWKRVSQINALEKEFAALQVGQPAPKAVPSIAEREKQVQAILQAMDSQGRWVSTYTNQRLVGQPKFKPGFRYLDSGVFSENIETLSAYLAAASKPTK